MLHSPHLDQKKLKEMETKAKTVLRWLFLKTDVQFRHSLSTHPKSCRSSQHRNVLLNDNTFMTCVVDTIDPDETSVNFCLAVIFCLREVHIVIKLHPLLSGKTRVGSLLSRLQSQKA